MIQNYLIIGMAILFVITLLQLHKASEEKDELLEKLSNKNRLIWDYETELLEIRSKIAEANDRAKTWELQANFLKELNDDKNQSTRGKSINK
jgi:predicted  nucleic acid-binding Zn-ribbon protein